MALWNIFRKSVLPEVKEEIPLFDEKYNVIINFPSTSEDSEKINWVSNNTGNRAVDVKFVDDKVFMAFENENDALIFRIKFLWE